MNQSDHDVLIGISVKLDRAMGDIKDLNVNLVKLSADKVDTAHFMNWSNGFKEEVGKSLGSISDSIKEAIKIVNEKHNDHETRLRRVERWGFTGMGALAIIQFVIGFLK